MNPFFCLPVSTVMRCSLYAVLVGVVLPAFSQAIPVTTPRLPPRSPGPSAVPQPAAQPNAQTYPQPGMQTESQPGVYATPAAQPAYQTGMYPAAQSPQSGMYPAQPPQSGMYPAQPPQSGMYPPQTAAYGVPNAPATVVTPQRAAAGNCRAQPSPDRQTLMLVSGTEALARNHVPLGEFRSQQIVHSPDGRWAVVFTKLRGAPQFAALTIDLERCEMQRTIEIPATGEDARFEGDEAVLRWSEGELRVGLRDGRVR